MIKLRASKCIIKNVDVKEERAFLQANHYQGYIPSKLCYGLYYNDELVCLMSFGFPRFNRRYDWELLRLCTRKDVQVYGGASKLFDYFKENNTGSIISYCNRSKFTGNVYNVLGFNSIGSCKSYHYEKDGKSYHRSNFQKWILVGKYPEYVHLTEKEIMSKLGYTRIEEIQETFVYGTKWYIYRIVNNVNGHTYIGQHLDWGDNYMGPGSLLKKYGIENFSKEILVDDIKTQKEADYYEIRYIARERKIGKGEYNIQDGGRRGHYVSHSSPTRWEKGHTPWNSGRKTGPLSETHKKRISEALMGRKDPRKGIHFDEYYKSRVYTEERAKKISEAKKGKKRGHWYTNGIDNKLAFECPEGYHKGFTAKKHTEEWKEKMSEYGKTHPNRGQFQKGHIMSEEARKKISEAKKGIKPKGPEPGAVWWTNGTENKRVKDCPGFGWKRGRKSSNICILHN